MKTTQLTAAHRQYGRKDGGADPAQPLKEFKEVMAALEKRDTEIKSFCDKASEEIKNLGKIGTDTKAALEKLSAEGVVLQGRLMEVEQKLAARGLGRGDNDNVKSLGQLFTEHDDFKALQAKGRGVARLGVKTINNITSATTGTGGVGDAIVPQRLPGIIAPPDRPMTIRDLIMPGRTASSSVEFVQESGFQNAARMVTEGQSKPQSDITFDLVTAPVRTLAHWFRASKQILADVPLLQSYLDGRLRYGLMYVEETELLTGDGTGQHLHGLIPQATAFDTDLLQTGDTQIDFLRRSILQVRLAEYRASAIVLNPVDWTDIELLKDSVGNYIWSNPQVNNGQNLWGLPVIDTNAMPQGEFMTGAFNIAAQVLDREDANVIVSTEDADNVTKNMVTILGEERLALTVFRPESFIHGAF